MQKQVDSSHYAFTKYVDKRRWASVWYQLDEVLALNADHVLEIGPGPGIFAGVARTFGVRVETLDLDPELKPDHVESADRMPFRDNAYDIVCAFQMLEHVPYKSSLVIFREMVRVAGRYVVISLPDARPAWPFSFPIPMRAGDVRFFIPRPWLGAKKHKFDGEHYWEINKKHFSLKKIIKDYTNCGDVELKRSYRIPENPYHRLFVFWISN